MKVLIDALSARIGAGITYNQYLSHSLVRCSSGIEFVYLLSRRYQDRVVAALPAGMRVIDTDLPPTLPMRWWYQQTELPRLLKKERFDLLFSASESSYLSRLPCPVVMLAANQSLYEYPSSFRDYRLKSHLHRWLRAPLIFPSLRRATRVVFVSRTFRDQVCQHLRLPLSKTHVVYHGVSPAFHGTNEGINTLAATTNLDMRKSSIVSVSTLNPHKNYETLIRALSLVVKIPELSSLKLVIVGDTHATPSYYDILLNLVAELGLIGRVHFVGSVSHPDIVGYYQSADIFVFPSRLETFGMPLVEAMASGTAVISSDLPICREVCSDAALYFDPCDVVSLAGLIRQVLGDRALRDDLVRRGLHRAQDFSWDIAAHQMIEIFREAVGAEN